MGTENIERRGHPEAAGDDAVHKYLDINSDTILNSIADGVVVIGLDHRMIFINRAAREILGKAGAEDLLSGARCGEVMGHSGCTFGCLINSTIKTGEHFYNYEATFERGDKKIILSINTALLKDKNGQVIGE